LCTGDANDLDGCFGLLELDRKVVVAQRASSMLGDFDFCVLLSRSDSAREACCFTGCGNARRNYWLAALFEALPDNDYASRLQAKARLRALCLFPAAKTLLVTPFAVAFWRFRQMRQLWLFPNCTANGQEAVSAASLSFCFAFR